MPIEDHSRPDSADRAGGGLERIRPLRFNSLPLRHPMSLTAQGIDRGQFTVDNHALRPARSSPTLLSRTGA